MNDLLKTDFELAATEKTGDNLLWNILGFLSTTKKWWLFPVLVVTLLMGLLLLLSGTAAAPFIYTLF